MSAPPSIPTITTPGTSSTNTRRVARRACLSCREKKIKCNGEPMTTITAADGTNRIIPEKTRTCSNCRFLGIPCVFVQSNRGGKRKKRSTEHQLSDSEATTAPATHPNQLGQHQQLPPIKKTKSTPSIHNLDRGVVIPSINQQQERHQDGYRNEELASTERVSSYILDGNNSTKLPSPVLTHTTFDSRRDEGQRFNNQLRQSSTTTAGFLLPPPQELLGRRLVSYSPGPSSIKSQLPHLTSSSTTTSSVQSPPPPPPPPQPPHGMGIQFHEASHQPGIFPPPPPPPPPPPQPPHPDHLHHQYYGYPPPPPPPPPLHHHHHYPPPHHPGFGFPPPPPGPPGLPGPPPVPPPHYHQSAPPESPPKEFKHRHPKHFHKQNNKGHRHRHHPHHHHPPPPPHHHHHHPRDFQQHNGQDDIKSKHTDENSQNSKPSLPRWLDNMSVSSLDSSRSVSSPQSQNNDKSQYSNHKSSTQMSSCTNSVTQTLDRLPKIVSTQQNNLTPTSKILSNSPFTESELAKYDLPKWEVLNKIFNYYYIYNQPSHQIFPGKAILLENLALNTDSSIIHAIIATTCLIISKYDSSINIVADELYWINKMHKFWDNLNDLGILCCYKLLVKCTSIRFNIKKMNDINIKLWEMINNNQYVDIFKQKKFDFQESRIIPTFGTKRQNYERELTLKIIWSFYINNIILLRFNQGRPYYKLSSIMNGFKFDYDRDQYSNNILLPMSDIDYLSLKSAGNRTNWNQLYEKSHIPTDATSLILSLKSFENSLSKLSNKDITFSNLISKDEFHVDLRNKLKTKYYEIIHDEKLVVINTNYWFSNIILRLSELIQYNYILCDIMVFKMCKYDWKADLGCNSDDRGDSKDTNTTQGEKCQDADGNSIQHKENYKDSVSNPGLLQHPLISDEIQLVEGLTTKLKSLNNNDWKILIEMIKSTNEYVDLIKLIPLSEYTDYSIVVGPTTFDDNYNNENETTKRFRNLINNSSEWWNKQELKSSVQQSWAKLPIYILSFTSGVLSIIYSLAVLTKYIKFKKSFESGDLIVEFLETNETRTIEGCNISVPQQKQMADVYEIFTEIHILSQLFVLCEYVKFKLSYSNEDLAALSIQRLNNLNQHLDEVLQQNFTKIKPE